MYSTSLRWVVTLLLLCTLLSDSKDPYPSTPTRFNVKFISSPRKHPSSIGKHRVVSLQTSPSARFHHIFYGSTLQLRCSNARPEPSNGPRMACSWLPIGASMAPVNGVLDISPLLFTDTGRWQCSKGGEFRGVLLKIRTVTGSGRKVVGGAVAVEVIGISDAYRIGVIDYLTTSFFFQPIFVIGLLCLSTRHLDPPMPSHDPIADLLTKQIDGTQWRDRIEGNNDGSGKVKESRSPRIAQRTIRAMLHRRP